MKFNLLFVLICVLALCGVSVAVDIPDVLPDPDNTPPDSTKPVKVYILSGQSNMVGFGRIAVSDPNVLGTLEVITKTDGLFPHLVDDASNWTVRNDVRYRGVISAVGNDLLKPGFGADTSHIGPELGFGHVMGYFHDEPVLLIKTSIGNRSIIWDCLPPGSPSFLYNGTNYGGYGDYGNWLEGFDAPTTGGWYAGKQYDDYFLDEADMGPRVWVNDNLYTAGCQVRSDGVVYNCKTGHTSSLASQPGVGAESSTYWTLYSIFNVTDILDNFAAEYPQYAAQGFEIAGYVWWQGHKDQYEPAASRYELNMVKFIHELRGYYENRYPENIIPCAPFVLATIAFGGWDLAEPGLSVANGQLATSDPTKHPELEGNVATVEARGYWRDSSVSPTDTGYHYNHNAETFMLTGDALGRAMAELMPAYKVHVGDDMITWSGEPVELNATVQEGVSVTSYLWTAIPPDGAVFSNPTGEDTTVTITKTTENPSSVFVRLTVNDGVNDPVADIAIIDVYDDSCKAARIGLGINGKYDLDGNCVTGIDDLAIAVSTWLNDASLTGPVMK